MSFFPLPMTAELQQESTSSGQDRSGQVTKAWTTIAVVNCQFMTNSGAKITQAREEFEQTDSFYVDPTAPIQNGMRVVNIRDSLGNVIEAGPLYVHSVKRFAGFGGKIHHQSCKLTGKAQ